MWVGLSLPTYNISLIMQQQQQLSHPSHRDRGIHQQQHRHNISVKLLPLEAIALGQPSVFRMPVGTKSFTKAPSNFYLTFSEGNLGFYRSGLMNFEVTRVLRTMIH